MVTFNEGSLLFASAAVDGPPVPPPTITRFLPIISLLTVTLPYYNTVHDIPCTQNEKNGKDKQQKIFHTISDTSMIVKYSIHTMMHVNISALPHGIIRHNSVNDPLSAHQPSLNIRNSLAILPSGGYNTGTVKILRKL
jgi:hypothetical protein